MHKEIGDLNIGDSSIRTGAFPPILSWFSKSNLIQYHDPPLPETKIDVIQLDSIYLIVNSNPDLCQREIRTLASARRVPLRAIARSAHVYPRNFGMKTRNFGMRIRSYVTRD